MKQKIISYMSMSIVMAVLLLTTPSSAQATTVVNSLYSKSSTGGHTVLSGEDGKDGEDGQDGKKGENGKSVSSSNAHASVFVKSVIDGVPVNDLSEVKIQDQQTEPLVVMWMSTTSVDDYDSFVHVTTEGDAIARTGANNYVTVQELLSAIHLILISYVSKLF